MHHVSVMTGNVVKEYIYMQAIFQNMTIHPIFDDSLGWGCWDASLNTDVQTSISPTMSSSSSAGRVSYMKHVPSKEDMPQMLHLEDLQEASWSYGQTASSGCFKCGGVASLL